jgi:hypothetical protein
MIYKSAEDLWKYLTSRAGVDVGPMKGWPGVASALFKRGRKRPQMGPYDVGLVDDLRDALFPGSDATLEYLLKWADPPISAETLLRAFLKAVQPFSMMKVGILEMLSAAGASQSDSNIRVRFQFDRSDEPLDLLLNDFRDQFEVIERQLLEVPKRIWTPTLLWRIPHVAESFIGSLRDPLRVPVGQMDQRLQEWIDRYESTSSYEEFPQLERTGIAELDVQVEKVSELLQDILTEYKRHGQTREELRSRSGPDTSDLIDHLGITVSELWLTESDYWAGAVARWLQRVRALAFSGGANSNLISTIETDLATIIPPDFGRKATVERLHRRLEDILNLPVWKRRNEVYAVWIGSQIWQALKDNWDIHFHVVDKTLSFAFSGVHLATLVGPGANDTVVWWTELRTGAKTPSGKRKEAIKPDYRLQRSPLSGVNPDILVVEVKQYKGSSGKSNFLAAIEDYAFACPNAHVVLTNYGPVTTGTISAIPRAIALASVPLETLDPTLTWEFSN